MSKQPMLHKMPSESLSDGIFQVVFRNGVEKTERNKNVFM